MNNKFCPMLACDDKVDLSKLNYPLLASYKMDGIRCIFKDGRMISRTLKNIPNRQLQEKFQNLKDYSNKYNIILDGELYGEGLNFQQITHNVMTEDLEELKEPEKLLDNLKFFCFDIIDNYATDRYFIVRQNTIQLLELDNLVAVKQILVESKEEVEVMFKEALSKKYEGLILRSLQGEYKFGRATLREGTMLKVKPYLSFDAEIIKVEERFLNTNESTKDELGHSKKRNTVKDKESTGIAATFVVNYKGQEQRVIITGDLVFRKHIWINRDYYIGKWIEFTGMLVGSKNLVRHPTFLRFRGDKNDK